MVETHLAESLFVTATTKSARTKTYENRCVCLLFLSKSGRHNYKLTSWRTE